MHQSWGKWLAIALWASSGWGGIAHPSVSATPSIIISQAPGAEQSYVQLEQSMGGALNEILPFLTGVSQIEQVQTDDQLLGLAQQLAPMAQRITHNFSQAYQAGEQLLPKLPAGRIETEFLGTVVAINGLGALAFSPWQEIFSQIQQAYQSNNPALLESAIAKIPGAAMKLTEFAGQFQSVMAQGEQIQSTVSRQQNMSAQDFERLSAIQRMGHETSMSILNNIKSDGEWRFNSGSGRYEYQYY